MRRQTIPLRKRFFVGCEGQSEQSYVKFLYELANSCHKSVHLDARVLKEGDPLARLEFAIKIIRQAEASHGKYVAKFAMLDFDQYHLDPQRSRIAENLSEENGIKLLWQRPDHEGFLCRHFNHLGNRHILDKKESLAILQHAWGTYRKPLPATQIGKTLDMEHVLRAAEVLPDFKRLIIAIGLLED